MILFKGVDGNFYDRNGLQTLVSETEPLGKAIVGLNGYYVVETPSRLILIETDKFGNIKSVSSFLEGNVISYFALNTPVSLIPTDGHLRMESFEISSRYANSRLETLQETNGRIENYEEPGIAVYFDYASSVSPVIQWLGNFYDMDMTLLDLVDFSDPVRITCPNSGSIPVLCVASDRKVCWITADSNTTVVSSRVSIGSSEDSSYTIIWVKSMPENLYPESQVNITLLDRLECLWINFFQSNRLKQMT